MDEVLVVVLMRCGGFAMMVVGGECVEDWMIIFWREHQIGKQKGNRELLDGLEMDG